MPFDPKLIHPDQAPLLPDGEIDLPPDLAALGEQLRDDARHLAACYPADREAALPAGKLRSRRWKKVAVLAASAAATLLAGIFAVQQFARTPVPQANRGLPAEPRDLSVAVPSETQSAAPILIRSSTTVSLTDLSEPELEALLDLWQREPSQAEGHGISF